MLVSIGIVGIMWPNFHFRTCCVRCVWNVLVRVYPSPSNSFMNIFFTFQPTRCRLCNSSQRCCVSYLCIRFPAAWFMRSCVHKIPSGTSMRTWLVNDGAMCCHVSLQKFQCSKFPINYCAWWCPRGAFFHFNARDGDFEPIWPTSFLGGKPLGTQIVSETKGDPCIACQILSSHACVSFPRSILFIST